MIGKRPKGHRSVAVSAMSSKREKSNCWKLSEEWAHPNRWRTNLDYTLLNDKVKNIVGHTFAQLLS